VAVTGGESVVPQADALWDAYLLYAANARWDDDPPAVISWGSTILETQQTLERDILRIAKH
jgi:hypothetical protein